ncbi:MAG: glycoside hydrolase family 3 protein, partial [Chloroflexi bacterium]|nr:glycoside hydrolase family 3 protein [Chloroflexota bacterium]
QRIFALKEWAASQPQPDLDVVGCAAHQKLAQEAAERSITLVRNEADLLPLRVENDARIAVIMPQPQNLTPADTSSFVVPTLAQAVRTYHPHVDEFITQHAPSDDEIAAIKAKAAQYDLLLVGTISASMEPVQAALVNELLQLGIPTVTIALRTPYDLAAYPKAQTHLCTYSILEPSMRALSATLWGKIPISGHLPVSIPNLVTV